MRSSRPRSAAKAAKDTAPAVPPPASSASQSSPGSVPVAEVPTSVLPKELANLYFDLMMKRSYRPQDLTADFDLNVAQARTLMLMDPDKSVTMSELAQNVFLEPSNLTGVIDKLEARGLVKRSLAPADRRVKLVSITRPGAALRARIYARLREPEPWMLALSERDQRQLLGILRKALAFVQQTTGGKT